MKRRARNPFSRRMVAILLPMAGVSLFASFAAAVFWGDSPDVRSNLATSFSTSAIGHVALVEVLERVGHRVMRSRHASANRATDGMLLLIEPSEYEALDDLLLARANVLVVLPKWRVVRSRHERRREWVGRVEMRSTDDVDAMLDRLEVDAEVERVASSDAVTWSEGSFDHLTPDVRHLQLVDGGLDPVIHCDAGTLLGVHDLGFWVLSDPDLLSNHGIGRGDNARLAVDICDWLADGGMIVVDETSHGLGFYPSVWSELGRFPLVLAFTHGCAVVLLLLWCGMRRFGPPLPQVEGLAAGKELLIDNTTQLLLHGGHARSIVRHYFDRACERVAAAYHVPSDLSHKARAERLAQIGEEGRFERLQRLVGDAVSRTHEPDEDTLVAAARETRLWREETLHGTR